MLELRNVFAGRLLLFRRQLLHAKYEVGLCKVSLWHRPFLAIDYVPDLFPVRQHALSELVAEFLA